MSIKLLASHGIRFVFENGMALSLVFHEELIEICVWNWAGDLVQSEQLPAKDATQEVLDVMNWAAGGRR